MELFLEGLGKGAPAKAIADLIGICSRTLQRWGAFEAYGFSKNRRKGSPRAVAHRFSEDERHQVLTVANDSRFADLTSAQIVAILAEEGVYVGSESTIYRIMRQEGLLNHCGRSRPPREPREAPVLEATAELGVSLSFSRPQVSNDNAYAESWFRRMKYHQLSATELPGNALCGGLGRWLC